MRAGSELWPEIVAAGKDKTVNADFVAEIGRRIAQGDTSGSKTASAINQTYKQLENRGELGLAENCRLEGKQPRSKSPTTCKHSCFCS